MKPRIYIRLLLLSIILILSSSASTTGTATTTASQQQQQQQQKQYEPKQQHESRQEQEQHQNIPIKIFLLGGQSNMVGMGSIDHLDILIHNNSTKNDKYRTTLWNSSTTNEQGQYNIYNDIYIKYNTNSGPLTISRTKEYAGKNSFGIEILFGTTIHDYIYNTYYNNTTTNDNDDNESNDNNQNNVIIVLIKVAYGGRDLAIDFRPPSAGIGNYSNVNDITHYGWEYRVMIHDIIDAIQTLPNYIPNYYNITTMQYEILGFLWFQGWNDLLDWDKVKEYESNLAHLIRDIRTDLNQTNLPFVIGELGMHGLKPTGKEAGRVYALRAAQRAVCNYTEFQSNTIFVPTASYAVLDGATYNGIHHYYGRADTYYDIGQAFGNAMITLLEKNNNSSSNNNNTTTNTTNSSIPENPNERIVQGTFQTSWSTRSNLCISLILLLLLSIVLMFFEE